MAQTMKAVVFKGVKQIALEDRPVPQILDPTDAVVKVSLTALCGSELHVFRGHQESGTGFIMGHEFVGEISEVGPAVKHFRAGDKVVSPFTVSCLECFYCQRGETSRCTQCKLYGSAALDGAQAEYVRIPLADGTLFPAPEGIPDDRLVLMADIFPTGYYGARNAFASLAASRHASATAVLIGCGPVGLCALIAALEYKPAHMFAIDSVPDRLELAKSLGAEPLNFKEDPDGMRKRILEVTEGRGADMVIEVVGNSAALRTGFELLRPFGMLSSVGVHNAEYALGSQVTPVHLYPWARLRARLADHTASALIELCLPQIPISGNEAYGKNLRIQFGRCPVRAVFPEALELLKKKSHLLGFMADKIMPLSQAEAGYEIFDSMQAQKVIFQADR